ncbi:glycosyl transferase [Flavihumibacter sp. R14]|nr:glycosyl transferase [Flavihumibacter soli]
MPKVVFLFQHLINIFYRHPKSALKKYRRFGGILNYLKINNERNLMKKASLNLPTVISNPEGLPIYFLTGKDYLYQTLFCIHSLSKATKVNFKFILIDDGSMDDLIRRQIHHQLPGSQIITSLMIKENLNNFLPQHLYPYLHHKRSIYPHIKKLTDIHTIPGSSWKLVLDSDMLFLNEPDELISWLQEPKEPLHMIDCEESYGYSEKLMSELSRTTIPSLVNVGAIGLNSQQINWKTLEAWAQSLEEKEGACYYLEQALTAMLIGDKKSTVLDKKKYIVNPSQNDIINQNGVLHHYVDLSKEGYFKKAWKMHSNQQIKSFQVQTLSTIDYD